MQRPEVRWIFLITMLPFGIAKNITIGYLTSYAPPVLNDLLLYWPALENSASAISLAIEDFTAKGHLQDYDFK